MTKTLAAIAAFAVLAMLGMMAITQTTVSGLFIGNAYDDQVPMFDCRHHGNGLCGPNSKWRLLGYW